MPHLIFDSRLLQEQGAQVQRAGAGGPLWPHRPTPLAGQYQMWSGLALTTGLTFERALQRIKAKGVVMRDSEDR
jgi:hypothetical protein